MGIPGFYGKWLSKSVQESIFNSLPPFVSSLSFDLNGVFHEARKIIFKEEETDIRIRQAIANTDPLQLEIELHNAVAAIILKMVQAANPLDCLILAVDGVAPGAKQQQQRGRRERAAKERTSLETFDRNAITPGTEFMMRLDNFLIRFIGSYRKYLPPKIIYSSHLAPGEGEHKIMDYYRRGEVSDGTAAKNGGCHILYGLDADLIMLSLLAPINNIYLSRENVTDVISIDQVKNYLTKGNTKQSAIDDFVIIMFLIGNDFLPHMPALEETSESISSLLDIYYKGNYTLTQVDDTGRYNINWDNMKTFIQDVATTENQLLAGLSVRQFKYPSRFLQSALIDGQFYPKVFRSSWYQNALGPKGPLPLIESILSIIGTYIPTQEDTEINSEFATKTITNISAVTPERIEKMTIDYMRTMSWVYLYYREGTTAINSDWSYPYYHSPLLTDLASVIQTINVTRTITGFQSYEGMLQFTALHQLAAVLPLKSKELLPIELQPLFGYNSIIRDLFPSNFNIQMDGKDKDYEGVPIVPLIDRQRIFEAVTQIFFTPERAKLWIPIVEQFFNEEPNEIAILQQVQLAEVKQRSFLNQKTYFSNPNITRPTFNPRGRGRGTRGTTRGGLQRGTPRQQFRQSNENIYRPRGQQTPTPTRVTPTQSTTINKPRANIIPNQPRQNTQRSPRRAGPLIQRLPGESPIITPNTQTVTNIIQRPTQTQPQINTQQKQSNIKPGPTLVPVGSKIPTGLLIGKTTGGNQNETQEQIPLISLTEITQGRVKSPARSPAEWKKLPNLL